MFKISVFTLLSLAFFRNSFAHTLSGTGVILEFTKGEIHIQETKKDKGFVRLRPGANHCQKKDFSFINLAKDETFANILGTMGEEIGLDFFKIDIINQVNAKCIAVIDFYLTGDEKMVQVSQKEGKAFIHSSSEFLNLMLEKGDIHFKGVVTKRTKLQAGLIKGKFFFSPIQILGKADIRLFLSEVNSLKISSKIKVLKKEHYPQATLYTLPHQSSLIVRKGGHEAIGNSLGIPL